MENTEYISQEVNTDQTGQTQPTNPVGTEGHSPQVATPPATDNQVGGPNQIAAETRRAAEAYNRLQSDPAFVEFQEYKKQQQAQRLAAEAQANQVTPEVWERLTSMERMVQEQKMQAEFAGAQREFQSFASNQGMDGNTQMEFLGWLENNLGSMSAQAAKPGFNYDLYVDAFARHKGLLATTPTKPTAPVYVPGHGSGAAQVDGEAQQLHNRIKERVKGY